MVSRITDRVIRGDGVLVHQTIGNRRVYAAVFIDIDAIMVKVRDGQVGNRPIYAAIGVDLQGHKDILGIWAGQGGGESAKSWMAVQAGEGGQVGKVKVASGTSRSSRWAV